MWVHINSSASELSIDARRYSPPALFFPWFRSGNDVVLDFCRTPLVLMVPEVPEVPEVPPFIPPDAKVLNIDTVLREHLADLPARHTGHGVAIHDGVFPFR